MSKIYFAYSSTVRTLFMTRN